MCIHACIILKQKDEHDSYFIHIDRPIENTFMLPPLGGMVGSPFITTF